MDITPDKYYYSGMYSDKVNICRALKIHLPTGQSAFLWGPRQTGKTTLLHDHFPQSIVYNLLRTDTFLRLSKQPFRLRQELSTEADISKRQPIIIDEIQKIPPLLDEVHELIESKRLSFILCGSSARKLKQSHANMLGGRGWRFQLHPLTFQELGNRFDLMQALNRGLVPSHYLSSHYSKSIKAYIENYLKEEIQSEGLVRNLPAFARFLDSVPFSNGELVNFSNIARECAIDAKTVAQYYQILIDTLMGYFLEPFRKVRNRQIISATPKFYFFDVGIAGGLVQRTLSINKGEEFGKAFEHFILMELMAYRSYSERDFSISFWRTKDGHEVDFILNKGEIALETKGTHDLNPKDLKGLRAFVLEHKPRRAFLVCQESVARKIDSGIEILPWKIFLEKLWAGEVV